MRSINLLILFGIRKNCLRTYKKDDKTDCSNNRGMQILSTTYKILSNILPSRLTPYAEEITGDH